MNDEERDQTRFEFVPTGPPPLAEEPELDDWFAVYLNGIATGTVIRPATDDAGAVVCTGLFHEHLTPAPLTRRVGEEWGTDQRGIVTAKEINRLPLGKILDDFAFWIMLTPGRTFSSAGLDPEIERAVAALRARFVAKAAFSRRPTVKLGHDHYAKVLKAYREAEREAPDAPTRYFTDHARAWYGHPVSEATARRWLAELERRNKSFKRSSRRASRSNGVSQ